MGHPGWLLDALVIWLMIQGQFPSASIGEMAWRYFEGIRKWADANRHILRLLGKVPHTDNLSSLRDEPRHWRRLGASWDSALKGIQPRRPRGLL